jgi:hypothetical protein
MSTATLYSTCAVAGILSGIFLIVGSVFNNLVKTGSGGKFNFFAALFGLFGVMGVYLWQHEKASIFGLIAFVLVFIGLVLIACIDYISIIMLPKLSVDEMTKLMEGTGMMIIMFSGMIFLVGEILFSISVIIAGLFSSIAAVLWMIGFLPTPLGNTYPKIVLAGSFLSAIGIIWLSLNLWSFVH